MADFSSFYLWEVVKVLYINKVLYSLPYRVSFARNSTNCRQLVAGTRNKHSEWHIIFKLSVNLFREEGTNKLFGAQIFLLLGLNGNCDNWAFLGPPQGGGWGSDSQFKGTLGPPQGGAQIDILGPPQVNNCRAYGGVNNIRALWGHFTAF